LRAESIEGEGEDKELIAGGEDGEEIVEEIVGLMSVTVGGGMREIADEGMRIVYQIHENESTEIVGEVLDALRTEVTLKSPKTINGKRIRLLHLNELAYHPLILLNNLQARFLTRENR
jgi:hypothetical protein